MELFRVHAYSVSPLRTLDVDAGVPPAGGAVRITASLRAAMETNSADANQAARFPVDFAVDPATRTNEIRELVLDFAFGEASTATAAGRSLAHRLAGAMDRRSLPCLFVPTALREDDKRRVVLWIFPREEAFRLRTAAAESTLEVLSNVFSQKSTHRKAATFQGRHSRSDFLKGRVLDHQANQISRDVADFWIDRFLLCKLSLQAEAGTRLLAKTLKKALEQCEEPADREQLYNSMLAIRTSPRPRISLATFAKRYLGGAASEAFLRSAPNVESRDALFDFRQDTFDTVLQFRVFHLDSGVFVSAPLEEVGESVRVNPKTRELSCSGIIIAEQARARHA